MGKKDKTGIEIPVMAVHVLTTALPKLNMSTLSDFRVLNGVLSEIEEKVEAKRKEAVAGFFEKHSLKEDVMINQEHVLYKAWMNEYVQITIELSKDKVVSFTEDFFNKAIQGVKLSFDELKVIDTFLISSEK